MTLYLVRHGEAVEEAEDPTRPLSQRGHDEVATTARVSRRLSLEADRIVHSGKLRARQTAEIWAAALEPKPQIEEYAGLAPMSDPRDAAGYVTAARESLMLVGHLPHLGRLLATLVIGDPAQELIAYPAGAVVALVRTPHGWRIEWLLTPTIAMAVVSAM
jgi:phosphohistidine phosphatase